MDTIKVGVLVGSLRRDSFTKKVALALCSMLPREFEAELLDIGQLAMFNQDFDDDGATPEAWAAFRKKVEEMDCYLFCTPEYNRSVPPVLKNALDIASRPYGQNKWGGKPGAVVSASPGNVGGFGANHHLRQSLSFLDVYTMQQPEVYLSGVHTLFDGQGTIIDESAKGFLQQTADAFAAWVKRFQ
ncbi:MAG: NADPH-dependent FMN reductase [Oscillospiraceae bacterium]